MSDPPVPPDLEEYTGYKLVGVAIAFTVLEVTFVALRFVARSLGNVKFAIDDALMLPGLVFCIAINTCAIVTVLYTGVGHHLSYVAARDSKMLILLAKFLIIQSYLYLVAVALPKLAMLSIYIRVFPNTIVRVICYILGSIVIIGCVVGLFFASFGCRPMAFFWDKNIPGGVCVDVHALYMWVSIPNLITDLIMLILPIPLVWNLRVPKPVKFGLLFTFLTGSIGLASSVFRFYAFTITNVYTDPPWISVQLGIWTIIEPGTYLVAACLPTLRPLVTRTWSCGKRTLHSHSRSRSHGVNGAEMSGVKGSEKGMESHIRTNPDTDGKGINNNNNNSNNKSGQGVVGGNGGNGVGVGVLDLNLGFGLGFGLDEDYFELVEAESIPDTMAGTRAGSTRAGTRRGSESESRSGSRSSGGGGNLTEGFKIYA